MGILFLVLSIVSCFALLFLLPFLITSIFIRKTGPNEAMIVYGYGGTKVIVGGSCVVFPRYQQAKYFSLAVMPFSVELVQEVYLAEQKTYVSVVAAVLIKVRTSESNLTLDIKQLLSTGHTTREELLRTINNNTIERSILKAVELFLDKSQSEREELIRTVIEGHLRSIIGQHTFDELVKEPERVTQSMFEITAADLDRMGLELISFTIQELAKTTY